MAGVDIHPKPPLANIPPKPPLTDIPLKPTIIDSFKGPLRPSATDVGGGLVSLEGKHMREGIIKSVERFGDNGGRESGNGDNGDLVDGKAAILEDFNWFAESSEAFMPSSQPYIPLTSASASSTSIHYQKDLPTTAAAGKFAFNSMTSIEPFPAFPPPPPATSSTSSTHRVTSTVNSIRKAALPLVTKVTLSRNNDPNDIVSSEIRGQKGSPTRQRRFNSEIDIKGVQHRVPEVKRVSMLGKRGVASALDLNTGELPLRTQLRDEWSQLSSRTPHDSRQGTDNQKNYEGIENHHHLFHRKHNDLVSQSNTTQFTIPVENSRYDRNGHNSNSISSINNNGSFDLCDGENLQHRETVANLVRGSTKKDVTAATTSNVATTTATTTFTTTTAANTATTTAIAPQVLSTNLIKQTQLSYSAVRPLVLTALLGEIEDEDW